MKKSSPTFPERRWPKSCNPPFDRLTEKYRPKELFPQGRRHPVRLHVPQRLTGWGLQQHARDRRIASASRSLDCLFRMCGGAAEFGGRPDPLCHLLSDAQAIKKPSMTAVTESKSPPSPYSSSSPVLTVQL